MESILVVDDDRFSQANFTEILKGEGYDSVAVDTGAEALRLISEGNFRVVVISMSIADIRALDLLSRIKQNDPAMEVIFVTSHGNTETAIAALKNGARDYLVKPINSDEFLHAIALSLEQRRLLDENSELKSLLRIFQTSQTIANCIETERLRHLILEIMMKEVGVDRGIGCYLQEGELVVTEVRGFSDDQARAIAGWVLREYPPTRDDYPAVSLLADVQERIPLTGTMTRELVRDLLVLSIRSRTGLQGIIILCGDPGSGLSIHPARKTLGFLLDQASLALDNAARYSRARELLNVDELTGLYNYRYLDIALDHEIKRSERFGSGFSVIFLDIDLLKQVNDRHGHLAGSMVLKEMGALLKRSLRDVDIIIRYGGDEFTIILVETNPDATSSVCERLRRGIENHTFLTEQGLNLRLTASLGYACYPTDTSSKHDLLEMADKAMYQSKFSGKNRVFHASVLLKRDDERSREWH